MKFCIKAIIGCLNWLKKHFIVYTLTLFGFGELAERLYKSLKK